MTGQRRSVFFPCKSHRLSSLTRVKESLRLRIVDTSVHLRCRPSELYLGALTSRGALQFFCYADTNVYEEDVVREWVQEVAQATVAYLGKETSDGLAGGAKL